MAQINLAPGTQYLSHMRRRRRWLYITAVSILVAVSLAWAIVARLNYIAARDHQRLNSELIAIEGEIARAGDEVTRVQQFEHRLQALGSLLEHHITWTPLLAELERLLLPSVILERLEATYADQQIAIRGTTGTMDEVAQLFASLQSTPEHATRFVDGHIDQVERRETATDPTQPAGVRYAFSMQLEVGSVEDSATSTTAP